jgi:uroporphyrinogen decarboxylase
LPIASDDKLLLRAPRADCERPPFWLMRQAGRYLQEYRAARARVASFMELCLTPELAAEVTLQPVRRFAMDGAILFSDILVVPHGLGQGVSFEEGQGPVLEPLRAPADLAKLSVDRLVPTLEPVYEAIRLLRRKLPGGTALIGFAGAPWTLAAYMIEGGSSRDFAEVKGWAYREPDSFARLIDLLVDAIALHPERRSRPAPRRFRFSTVGRGFCPTINCDAGVSPRRGRWCGASRRRIRTCRSSCFPAASARSTATMRMAPAPTR